MRLLRYGEAAILVEVADLDQVADLRRQLRSADLLGVRELVPAARTLLITFDPTVTGHNQLSQRVIRIVDDASALAMGNPWTMPDPSHRPLEVVPVEIPVHYRGDDLRQVAELTGLSTAEVVQRHTAAIYTVAFCGFAPGFAYLRGLDPRLWLPRRAEPRTRVPPGAVAIAGEWAAVYPSASPGGWQLIGHTEFPVWDVEQTPPSLLEPGTQVRFRCLEGL